LARAQTFGKKIDGVAAINDSLHVGNPDILEGIFDNCTILDGIFYYENKHFLILVFDAQSRPAVTAGNEYIEKIVPAPGTHAGKVDSAPRLHYYRPRFNRNFPKP